MKKIIKIGYFTLYIPHYRVGILSKLSQINYIDLKVYADQNIKENFSLPKPNDVSFILIQSKISKIKIWPFNIKIFIFWEAFKYLFKQSFDIYIFSNRLTELNTLLIPLFKLFVNKKIIVWGHGKVKKTNNLEFYFRKFIMKRADACVFYSDDIMNFWKTNNINSNKLFVARNTLDNEYIDKIKESILQNELKSFKIKNNFLNKKILLFSARLNEDKKPLMLCRVVEILKNKYKDIILIIIGDGLLKKEIENYIYQKSLKEHIKLYGLIYNEKEIAKYFLSCHIYFIPSAAGLSLIHAFCYGLPVITDNDIINHPPEINALINNYNGYICKTNNIFDFVEKISLILDNEQLRIQMSTNAYNTIKYKYNINIMLMGIIDAINFVSL